MNKHVGSIDQKIQATGNYPSFLSPGDDPHFYIFSRGLQAVYHTHYYQEVSYKDLNEKIELDAILLIKYCS